MNNDSVGKKIVEALKKQAETLDMEEQVDNSLFESEAPVNIIGTKVTEDVFNEPKQESSVDFFDDLQDEKETLFMTETIKSASDTDITDSFEMPSNISVLKKLISQLPSGVSRHTGAQIIKQTMEALGISMKSVLQDAQQVQETLKSSARECQGTIQEYKKQILVLERQSQSFQKQYSALNDLISLFIQTTK
ncbi:MAG: hypothetical protein MJ237_03030 [bacterium]|nr:hypothetical protein [bacterium]